MSRKLDTTASAGWRTEYRFNHVATAAHGSAPTFSKMSTDSSASGERSDHDTTRYAPTDEQIERLVEILTDRLDAQGSPTYLKQRHMDDTIPRNRRGHAFRAVDRDPSIAIACKVWTQTPMLWQVRRVDPGDAAAAPGGRA